jgi:antitoxin HicB
MRLAYPMRFTLEEGSLEVFNVEGIEPLDGIFTFGETMDDARMMARDALSGVLASMLDHGEVIPRPTHAEGPDIQLIEPEPEIVAPILLRWAREEARLTQGEVATRMGVTQQAYQRLERSGANPSVKTLARAARAMGRTLELAL